MFEDVVRINLNEGHPLSEIGDFFELHDLIVIVDSILVEGVGEHVDDGLADAFEVEDTSDLYVEKLLVVFLAPQSLVYQVNLEVLLRLDLLKSAKKTRLQLGKALLNTSLPGLHSLFVLFHCPAAYYPPVYPIGYLLFIQVFQKVFSLSVEFQATLDSIQAQHNPLKSSSYI